VAEVIAELNGFDPSEYRARIRLDLRNAIAAVASIRNALDATRLQYWLRGKKGKPTEGMKFASEIGHGRVQRWRIVAAPDNPGGSQRPSW
jgi:hypothetical protein